MTELYRPPRARKPKTLRETAMNTLVKKARVQGTLPPQLATKPPAITQQVSKTTTREMRRWRKRATRQRNLYRDYTTDIEDYFTNWESNDYCVPIYLLTAFSRLVDTQYDNDTIHNFYHSRRKFQKVGDFDPSEYEEGTGKYHLYFVRYHDKVYLSVYNYEMTHMFSICIIQG